MKKINDLLKLSIVIIPTVVITLLVLENTKNYLYAILTLVVTCSLMTVILYLALKWFKKTKK